MRSAKPLAAITFVLASLMLAGAGLQSTRPAASTQPQDKQRTVISVARDTGSLNTLVRALTQAELVGTLQGQGPFTVFAPDDKAFDKLPTGTLEVLLKEGNKQQLKTVLLYHIARGTMTADKLFNLEEVESVEGSAVAVRVMDGKILLNDRVQITKTNVTADNGVVHIIDAVMIPPTLN